MPDIGQQAPRKWVVPEDAGREGLPQAKGQSSKRRGGSRRPPAPLPKPSGRRARRRRMLFAVGLVSVAVLAVTVYIVWGGGAEALGLVDKPPNPTAGLDARKAEDVAKIAHNATRLTAGQVAELEQRISGDSGDMAARTALIASYNAHDDEKSSVERHEHHVLWLVEHEPTAPILGTHHAQLRFPDKAYKAGREALLKRLNKDNENIALLLNTSVFLMLHDPQMADKLLARGQALEPDDQRWALLRSELDLSGAPATAGKASPNLKALEKDLEKALKTLDGKSVEVPPGNPPFSQLGDLASTALANGDLRKAHGYAAVALRKAIDQKESWAYGEVVHVSWVVLGHLALKVERTDLAELYLLRATKIPNSPKLEARGPDTALAKALLLKGRKETVLEYLDRCKGFWDAGRKNGTLSRWMKQLRSGQDPDWKVQ